MFGKLQMEAEKNLKMVYLPNLHGFLPCPTLPMEMWKFHGRFDGCFMLAFRVPVLHCPQKKEMRNRWNQRPHNTKLFFAKRSPLTMWKKSSLALVFFRVKRCWGIGVFSGNTPRMCKDFEYEGWLPRAPKTYMFRCFLWYTTWFLGGQNMYFSWFWGLMVSQ